MTDATCRRELELEIPAEEVQKAMERVAHDFARVARIPGFRPGKAPVTLIRRRFAEDIKSEVVQSLVPNRIEQAVAEQKIVPVTRPQVDKVEFPEGGPLKFRATFEVLPEFDLADYKNLEVEVEALGITDEDVEKTLQEMRERAATFVPVEGRGIQNGDFAQLKLAGTPVGGGAEPIRADNVLCHVGAEETLEAFNENLRGAQPGEQKRFEVHYPEDYTDPKLAGKVYQFTAEVHAVKEKCLPELNDEFAKDVSDAATLEDLRSKVRQNLEAAGDDRQAAQVRNKILAKLVAMYDFPVPESLVEQQMDRRVERTVRALAAQGVDPRAVNVDWVSLRRRQREAAVGDVKGELILDHIATREGIDVTEEELEGELARLAERSGESATALRARLTKQGALDTIKSKLRSDKTMEWLCRSAQIRTSAKVKK